MTVPTAPLTAEERESLRHIMQRIELGYLLVTDSEGPTVAQATLRLLADHDHLAAEVEQWRTSLALADQSLRTVCDDLAVVVRGGQVHLDGTEPMVLALIRARDAADARANKAAWERDQETSDATAERVRCQTALSDTEVAQRGAERAVDLCRAMQVARDAACAAQSAAEARAADLLRAAEVAADNALAFKADRDAEQARWQDAIAELLALHDALTDGAGCDSGDPLDFSLAQIRNALGAWEDRVDEAQDDLAAAIKTRDAAVAYTTARDALVRKPVEMDRDALRELLREAMNSGHTRLCNFDRCASDCGHDTLCDRIAAALNKETT